MYDRFRMTSMTRGNNSRKGNKTKEGGINIPGKKLEINKSGSLKVYYTNSRSICNKIDLLRAVVCTEKIDIIAITESWLDMSGKLFMPEVQLEGYNIFHKDRKDRRGGGVVLYARKSLQCCVNRTIKSDDSTDSLWVDIKEGREKYLLG